MLACIDLGSNSFHLLIGDWTEGKITIIERLSERVLLGEGVSDTGIISAAAIERGLASLDRFKALMDSYLLQEHWAVGTNTFRVASNAGDFVAAAAKRGIAIETVSGEGEAALIYAGVMSALPASETPTLVVDVGGGSTEIIVGKGRELLLTLSLQVGSVTWRDRFFDAAAEGDKQREPRKLLRQMSAAWSAAKEVFAEHAPAIKKIGWDGAYASSGTMKMLSFICGAHGYGDGEVTLRGILGLQEKMAGCIAEDVTLPGLKEGRRDLLLPGCCVAGALMESLGLADIAFSPTALREGMLDHLARGGSGLASMPQGKGSLSSGRQALGT